MNLVAICKQPWCSAFELQRLPFLRCKLRIQASLHAPMLSFTHQSEKKLLVCSRYASTYYVSSAIQKNRLVYPTLNRWIVLILRLRLSSICLTLVSVWTPESILLCGAFRFHIVDSPSPPVISMGFSAHRYMGITANLGFLQLITVSCSTLVLCR
jgi:hypothetical protein